MANFSIGSDPEFMLARGGQFFSATAIVPGTKYERHAIGAHHAYYDNVMAECAVAPATSRDQFIENLRDCLKRFSSLVRPYHLVARASADYPASELQSPEALEIGCDPEFCAYELQIAEPPKQEFQFGTLRTAGGHIHIGSSVAQELFGRLHCVHMCDLFLGTASIFLDKDPTTQKRKGLYGKAGRFREPEWGVEYRSLSNFWLTSPKLVGLVFDMSQFVVDFVEAGKHKKLFFVDQDLWNDPEARDREGFSLSETLKFIGYDSKELRDAIDNMNAAKGKKFMELIRPMLPKHIRDQIDALISAKPFDLYAEWGLNG